MAHRVKLRNFGDYLDMLNAQPSVQDVEKHVGDWKGGYRNELIAYAITHYEKDRMLCQWALWAKAGGSVSR